MISECHDFLNTLCYLGRRQFQITKILIVLRYNDASTYLKYLKHWSVFRCCFYASHKVSIGKKVLAQVPDTTMRTFALVTLYIICYFGSKTVEI